MPLLGMLQLRSGNVCAARLRDATLKVLTQPQMRERLKDIGFEVGQPRNSDEMSKSLRTDYERVGAMLKAINFKPE